MMDLDDIVLNAQIMGALQNINIPERRQRFHIRDNPFELSDNQVIRLFRLNKAAVRNLIDIVEPHLLPQTRISAIDSTTKIMTALRFFASGSYQMDIGKNIYMAVSQPTVSRCIHEIIDILTREEIMNQWIQFPSTLAELYDLRTQFYRKFEFPGTIGCIDCTHVAIFPPAAENNVYPEHIYVNRKGYHSINTQLICDWRLRIMHINARYPGSTHDSFIWNNCNAKNFMINLYRQYPNKNLHLLGDSGYSLRPWMMTPIIGANEGTPEAEYNRKQMRCRALIEQCNGLLKMRFRCLLKHRVLHYTPATASKIIYTCAVLHNMCIAENVPLHLDDDNDDLDLGMYNDIENVRNIPEQNVRRIDPDLAAARNKQRLMIENYFS